MRDYTYPDGTHVECQACACGLLALGADPKRESYYGDPIGGLADFREVDALSAGWEGAELDYNYFQCETGGKQAILWHLYMVGKNAAKILLPEEA